MTVALFALAAFALLLWIVTSGPGPGARERPPYRDLDPDAMIIRDCRDRGEPLPWDPK